MQKINYELKAELLNNGSYAAYRDIKKSEYHSSIGNYDRAKYTPEQCADILATFTDEELKECNRIGHAHTLRYIRLKKRIFDMLAYSPCIFVTLTFNDNTLAKTNKETRRQYVFRFLKSQSEFYIANIDFGAEKHREHYHAVICGQVDVKGWQKYGNINVKKIKIKNEGKLAQYIAKLTNHAIKDTAQGSRIIYSKSMPPHILSDIEIEKLAIDKFRFKMEIEQFRKSMVGTAGVR